MKDNQLSNSEIASFASQMALILHAGISAYEGITIMKEDNDSEDMQPILDTIYNGLDNGNTLYHSLSESQAFPAFMLNMVQIGEESGELEEVMQSLSVHYQRLHDNNESLKSAITYPFIMMTMMFLVVIVLITQVLPIFNRVFEQLGSSITGFSKIILDFGMMLSNHAYIFIGIIIVLVILILYLTKNQKGKTKLYHFLGNWRFTKDITIKLALSKFTSGMAIALSSGLNIEESLDMATALVDHKELKKRIEHAKELMIEQDLSSSLVEAHVFTGMYARLMKLGSHTGNTDMIMRQIADQYDQETNERIHHLISIIEPTLVAVLSILVGIILLSVMLPLMGIMTSL